MVDREERDPFFAATSKVAVERDFHTVEVDGLAPDAFENAFACFEGELSASLDRITARRSIADEDDRALLFNLIGILAVKNPRFRESFRDFRERTLSLMMQAMTATPDRWKHR